MNPAYNALPEVRDAADTSQIIAMAWDDSTSFEAIALNYGLDEAQVIALMRHNLKARSFQVWRMRVRGRSSKHAVKQARQTTRIQARTPPALADNTDEFPLRESPATRLSLE
ncbi:TIGR03643 family protein [Limnohabitans sp.]|jgi:uncharacterized protein (TIGR03643 family)|uniref:TIGR03643 family protein n=1 Tax=Limnohabitans sp. TaxID=1907725 RepID=UPI0039BC33D2|nr:TIGR03643 family protein [Comamonadaceae bacterium]